MNPLDTTVIAAVAFVALSACTQMPVGQAATSPGAVATASDQRMAMMDMQMKSMRDMHEKMMRARSPEEHNALKSEHLKLMQDGMGSDDMAGMKGMHRTGAMPGDMAMRQHMLEEHLEMMQSMMQMMMDQMPSAPVKQ